MAYLSKDSLALMLICSNLGIGNNNNQKPYTLSQWNNLAEIIMNSSMKSPQAFFETTEEDWKKILFLKDEEIQRLKILLARAGQVGIEIENLESQGIHITTRAEKNYPRRLKEILKKNSPPIVYYAGDLDLADTIGVAVVGSRNIDESGLSFTQHLATKCAREHITIVSGGAKGVDSAAQSAALKAGGKVISFLSDGLGRTIKTKEVREHITQGKLLLLSSVNPKTGFTVYSAMDRNKYIYALSEFSVVVSSDVKKGGTWAGATENLNNRWVPLFVRQGEGVPTGNLKLMGMGAKPIFDTTIEDRTIYLYDWFKNNSQQKNDFKNEFNQMNIGSLLNNSEIQKNIITKTEQKFDLYSVVWPLIEKVLSEPRSQSDMCEILNVRKVQLEDWMERAIKDNKVKKSTKPLRYSLI